MNYIVYSIPKKVCHAIARLLLIFLCFIVHCVIIYVCMVPILLMLPNGGGDESFNLAAGLIVTWFCFNLTGSLLIVFIKKYGARLYIINMALLNIFLYFIFMFSHIIKKI